MGATPVYAIIAAYELSTEPPPVLDQRPGCAAAVVAGGLRRRHRRAAAASAADPQAYLDASAANAHSAAPRRQPDGAAGRGRAVAAPLAASLAGRGADHRAAL